MNLTNLNKWLKFEDDHIYLYQEPEEWFDLTEFSKKLDYVYNELKKKEIEK